MNVFDARIEVDGERLRFALAEGVSLDYDASEFRADLRGKLGRGTAVTVGVRPHAVRLSEAGLPAHVMANQWLGDQTHIAAEFAGGSIVSVIHDRARSVVGERISISIAAEDLHLFDTASGKAISHGGASA